MPVREHEKVVMPDRETSGGEMLDRDPLTYIN